MGLIKLTLLALFVVVIVVCAAPGIVAIIRVIFWVQEWWQLVFLGAHGADDVDYEVTPDPEEAAAKQGRGWNKFAAPKQSGQRSNKIFGG